MFVYSEKIVKITIFIQLLFIFSINSAARTFFTVDVCELMM